MKDETVKDIYALFGLIATAVVGYLWGGYVFSVLWAWFIVSAFAAPPLSLAQAIGVTLATRFVTVRLTPDKKEDREPGKAMATAFMVPLMFLAVGWMVKQWVPA